MKCLVKYCGRCSKNFPEHSFLTFPVDDITRSRWISFCRLDPEVEIKPSSRICSAHFEQSCFKPNAKGRKLRVPSAVPTIDAFLLDPESDADDWNKSLPLYSSPSLRDHNYANFIAIAPDWVSSEDEDDFPELEESNDDIGEASKKAGDEAINYAVIETRKEVGGKPSGEAINYMAHDAINEVCKEASDEASCEVSRKVNAASNKTNRHVVHGAGNEKSAFRLFRLANKWKERSKQWKSNAFYWKKKYNELNKQSSVMKKLQTVFKKDQMGCVLGNLKKVRKWSNETLVEGLQVRFACGRGYDKVRQLPYVSLPSYSCLLSKIKSVHFDTGFLHEIFELMKIKVGTMEGKDLDCGIILDEMSIDEALEFCTNNRKFFGTATMPKRDDLATHALVFMIAGIHERWKQNIAYEFTGNSIPKKCLKRLLDQIISMAESIGLKVHFVTSDCGASNKAMWHDYGVSTRKKTILKDLSIEHPVDAQRRLEFIPDPVHIFKNAVNGWISNAVIKLPQWYVEMRGLTTNEVHRDHLTQLVQHEKKQNFKMACKLLEGEVDFADLKTSNVDKMKVSNSTKYCNHSVAAGLMVLSENTGYDHVKATSVFLEDLSLWFDLMSSRSSEDALCLSDQSRYKTNINHLEMMVKLIHDIKVGTDGHWKPWQSAFIMATNAIIRLQKRLLVDSGYPILFTSRFTQDCVENLFSVIRSKQRRPTPLQFKSHLRSITLSQYMQEVRNASYDVDDREYLSGFMDYLNAKDNCQSVSVTSNSHTEEMLDFSKMDISARAQRILEGLNNAEINAQFHVVGYIMGSIKKNSNTCSHCLKYCTTSVPFNTTFGKFSSLVAKAKGKPYTFPSQMIFDFITCVNSIIQDNFLDKATIDKTKINLMQKALMSLPLDLPDCHNMKMKLIKRYLQFKMKTERIRKARKRKFDSRSMLN